MQLFRQFLSDLKETGKELAASIEIPDVEKKDIELQITENNFELKAGKWEKSKSEINLTGVYNE